MNFGKATLLVSLSSIFASDTFAFTVKSGRTTLPTVAFKPFALERAFPLFMSDVQEQSKTIEDVSAELRRVKQEFDEKLSAASTMAEAEALRREYLSKKGPINAAMGYMRLLPSDEKPKLGLVVNEIKKEMETTMSNQLDALELSEIQMQMEKDKIDVTLPGLGRPVNMGHRHPLSMTMEKAVDIFVGLGYDTVTDCEDTPEIETDYYCFEALNCPKDHPARDMQDTFYLTKDMEYMLRTHTSSVQIRQLEKRKLPFRIVAPGRVYRRDDIDATHSLMFHQVEILAIEKKGQLTLGHLKGTVEHFLMKMFGPNIQVRFRGSYFPFTEPSMEVDVFFRGRWLEVLGCGMVDPAVLTMAGIDPDEYSGFAAGFGVERFAMVIHGITDIREFYNNDQRFLDQFPYFYDDGMYSFLRGVPPRNRVEDYYRAELESTPTGSIVDDPVEQVNSTPVASVVEPEKKAEKKADNPSSPAGEIDVSKLDIRVGVIKRAWEHEDADKLFCEEIDIGEEAPRLIASGLRAHYKVEDLEGQRVLVLANLKSRNLVGFPSHGMVMCASSDGKVEFVEPPADAVVGDRVMVEGFAGEPATENQIIKRKMLDVIFPDLKTNAEGVACYKGVPLATSAGVCKAQNGLAGADVA